MCVVTVEMCVIAVTMETGVVAVTRFIFNYIQHDDTDFHAQIMVYTR